MAEKGLHEFNLIITEAKDLKRLIKTEAKDLKTSDLTENDYFINGYMIKIKEFERILELLNSAKEMVKTKEFDPSYLPNDIRKQLIADLIELDNEITETTRSLEEFKYKTIYKIIEKGDQLLQEYNFAKSLEIYNESLTLSEKLDDPIEKDNIIREIKRSINENIRFRNKIHPIGDTRLHIITI